MNSLEVEIPATPGDQHGRVFREPWEAQVFAMTLALYRAGWFQWPEWAAMLSEEIARAQAGGDPDTGQTYYRHWGAALERMIVERGLCDAGTLERYSAAWAQAARRTPHGKPIELMPEDFRRRSEKSSLAQMSEDSPR